MLTKVHCQRHNRHSKEIESEEMNKNRKKIERVETESEKIRRKT